jgi:RNA polymerase sigma factor (sigma-70 family)
MNNEILWEKFIDGDKDALSVLFKVIFDDLYGYGMRLTRNTEIVNDSIQDLFLKLWKNRLNLGPVEIVKPYLFKALRRQIISNLRWNRRYINMEEISEDFFDIEYSHEDFMVNQQIDKETNEKLVDLLNQLTGRQKEAIYLRYFQGCDFDTVSEIMTMNVQSVRNTIQRGLASLRDLLPIFFLCIPYLNPISK